MTERDAFEVRFHAAVRGYVGHLSSDLDPAELAHRIATTQPRRRGIASELAWRRLAVPGVVWLLLLLAALLVAAIGGALFIGSQHRSLPAVVPTFVCSAGSTPDTPGPVDQARPGPYAWSPTAFDRRAGKLIVLVGAEGVPGTTVETWTFDVCTNTWTRMHPNREPPLQVSSLVYDADSDLTIGVHSEDWVYPPANRSVWVYDLEADTWTELGEAPTDAVLMFWDPVSGLVFAGDRTYHVETDTWTRSRQAIAPEGVGCGVCVYDSSVDRVILYQEEQGDAPETWLLDPRTGAWARSGTETPAFRMATWAVPAILYDEAAKRTVVTGDFEWGTYDAGADRWEILDERAPPGMVLKHQVYDPVNGRLLVYGDVDGGIFAFDLVAREWTVLLEPGQGETGVP